MPYQIQKKLLNCLLFILIGIFCFTLFYHIDQVPFATWDESRHQVSAMEMVHHHNWIINSWMGKPDMWNLKPILSFLPTCISISLFGLSPLTLRLSSIIAALCLCGAVCYYTTKKYNIYSALIFVSLLFAASLLFKTHGFRAGDADSLFIFCQTMVVLALAYKNNTTQITLAAFFSALAFLTKSWHALFLGFPYIVAYGYLLKNKQFSFTSLLFPISAFFGPILIWLALRYPYDGFAFIKEMYRYDLLQRSSHLIAGHYHNGWYFLKQLFRHFSLITAMFIFALLYSCFIRKRKFFTYDIVIFLTSILTSFIIYSIAETRLSHYSYTHILLICVISAILIGRDINKYTKILTYILVLIAILYNMNTLHNLSKTKLPLYYQSLKENAYPRYQAIYTPKEITQAQRTALMVMGNFNDETIKTGNPNGKALVLYRLGATDNPDIKDCYRLTDEKLLNDITDQSETIRLYACSEKK